MADNIKPLGEVLASVEYKNLADCVATGHPLRPGMFAYAALRELLAAVGEPQPPARVLVEVDRGLVSAVFIDGNARVLVADYDGTDGNSDMARLIPQEEGPDKLAFVEFHEGPVSTARAAAVFDAVDAPEPGDFVTVERDGHEEAPMGETVEEALADLRKRELRDHIDGRRGHPLAEAREDARLERQAAREAWESATRDIKALHTTWLESDAREPQELHSMISTTIGILDMLALAIRPTITRSE